MIPSHFYKFKGLTLDASQSIHRGTSVIVNAGGDIDQEYVIKGVNHNRLDDERLPKEQRIAPSKWLQTIKGYRRHSKYSVKVYQLVTNEDSTLLLEQRLGYSLKQMLVASAISDRAAQQLKRKAIELINDFLLSELPLKNFGPELLFMDGDQKNLVVNTTSRRFVSSTRDDKQLRASIARTMSCLATKRYVSEKTVVKLDMIRDIKDQQLAYLIEAMLTNVDYDLRKGLRVLLATRPPSLTGLDLSLLLKMSQPNILESQLEVIHECAILDDAYQDDSSLEIKSLIKWFGVSIQQLTSFYAEVFRTYCLPLLQRSFNNAAKLNDSTDKTNENLTSTKPALKMKIKFPRSNLNTLPQSLVQRVKSQFYDRRTLGDLPIETLAINLALRYYELVIRPLIFNPVPEDLANSYYWMSRCNNTPRWF